MFLQIVCNESHIVPLDMLGQIGLLHFDVMRAICSRCSTGSVGSIRLSICVVVPPASSSTPGVSGILAARTIRAAAGVGNALHNSRKRPERQDCAADLPPPPSYSGPWTMTPLMVIHWWSWFVQGLVLLDVAFEKLVRNQVSFAISLKFYSGVVQVSQIGQPNRASFFALLPASWWMNRTKWHGK